jgi:FtsP/CotA-like multicopper oxidase with cupredoxin domain
MSGEANGRLPRRDFLRRAGLLGGLVVPAGLAGVRTGWWNPPSSFAIAGDEVLDGIAPSPPVVPFQAPFRTPPVLRPTRADADTDYYEITMRPATLEILPGRPTTIWGFNGQFPGPTIKARSGRRVVVRQRNELPDAGPSVHLHGGHVAPDSDGYPTDMIASGAAKDYVYPNGQIAATLSYHDHEMGRTGRNVYMGLFGAYLIEDDVEASLNLPSGDYDVPLIIQDRAFRLDGSLLYSPDMMHGALGDVILVNGVPQPRFEVANRKYRLRILNGSNAREYGLTLSSGQPSLQIATDGGMLPRPVRRTTIPLFPFERVEVVVDFSEVPVGSQVILRNEFDAGRTGQVMLFDVVRREADPSTLPSSLRPLERLEPASASATRDFTLGMDGMTWVINSQRFDPARVDATPRMGSTEIWRFQNRSGMAHPMHIHLDMFQILDRNGAPPSEAESGWKDTVAVGPDEVVRVIVRFTDYTGRYLVHCHNLEHEDEAMMAQFEVVPHT